MLNAGHLQSQTTPVFTKISTSHYDLNTYFLLCWAEEKYPKHCSFWLSPRHPQPHCSPFSEAISTWRHLSQTLFPNKPVSQHHPDCPVDPKHIHIRISRTQQKPQNLCIIIGIVVQKGRSHWRSGDSDRSDIFTVLPTWKTHKDHLNGPLHDWRFCNQSSFHCPESLDNTIQVEQ